MKIVPAQEKYIGSYWDAFGEIAAEKKYLGVTRNFSLERTRLFVLNSLQKGYPNLYVVQGGEVVGWCDVHPLRNGNGYLGMGLRKPYRDQGIGRKLLLAGLKRAEEFGYKAVESEVRTQNKRAIHLYQSVGFLRIQRSRRTLSIDGKKEVLLHMQYDFHRLQDLGKAQV